MSLLPSSFPIRRKSSAGEYISSKEVMAGSIVDAMFDGLGVMIGELLDEESRMRSGVGEYVVDDEPTCQGPASVNP